MFHWICIKNWWRVFQTSGRRGELTFQALNSLPTKELVSSADNFCKQFGSRSDPTFVGPDLDLNCLTF